MELIRLQKFIADSGHTSRRKAEGLMLQGQVKVNGILQKILGTKINPENDVVEVQGKILNPNLDEKIYLVLNKPRCVITSLFDPEGRTTVKELVPALGKRIYPVGRLDYLSEGLLIMTNDGDMANRIMHPRFKVVKTYEVKVFGVVTSPILKQLQDGVWFSDGLLKPKSVRVVKPLPHKTWLEFRLEEGKNREIRRLCEKVGLAIDKLRRVAIGGLSIEGLAPGNFDFLNKRELVQKLGFDATGEAVTGRDTYVSKKRTKNIRNKSLGGRKDAQDDYYQLFNRKNYYQTLESFKKKDQLSN